MEELKFCYEKRFRIVGKATHAVAIRSKYWEKGRALRIFFTSGSVSQISEMKKVIKELLDPLSLSAEYVDSADMSEIRIGFMAGYGSWSYLGTDCMLIPKNEQTLNIGWSGKDVMYHEFGHTLNLAHEHQNPKGGIVWDEKKVIADLSGAPNNWTIEEIRYNVLNRLNINQVDATDFDKESIMLYYFPNSWTIGDFQTNDNLMPSKTDRAFLLEQYGEIDVTAPEIELKGDAQIVVSEGGDYIELGAIATDKVDGDITDKITLKGNVDTKLIGLQYVVYSVSDKAGNKAEKIRTILIEKTSVEIEPKTEIDMEAKTFLLKLFPTKKRLSRITEEQLTVVASEIGIEASVDDFKDDTVDRIWNALNGGEYVERETNKKLHKPIGKKWKI